MDLDTWYDSTERKSIEVVQRSAGSLALLGSLYILQDILKDPQRRSPSKNRIILLMSICDLLFSLSGPILGIVMVPSRINVPGAEGNTTTCTIQGFMVLLFAAASVFCNVQLAICYLLIVRYEYNDEDLRNLEPWFLLTPLILSGAIAIPGLPYQVYNFEGTSNCYLAASPDGCEESDFVDCERGAPYVHYFVFVCVFLLLLSAFIIITSMVLMYATILQRERNNDQHRFWVRSSARLSTQSGSITRTIGTSSNRSSAAAPTRRTLSNTMRSQGLWYSGAFLFSFLPEALSSFVENYSFHIFVAFTVNMLGFSNALVYVRPRFLKFRRDYPNVGIWASCWYVLCRTHSSRISSGSDNSNGGVGRDDSQRLTFLSLRDSFWSMKYRLVTRIQGSLNKDTSNEMSAKQVEPQQDEDKGSTRRKSFLVVKHQEYPKFSDSPAKWIVEDAFPVRNDCQMREEEEGIVDMDAELNNNATTGVGLDPNYDLENGNCDIREDENANRKNFDVGVRGIDDGNECQESVADTSDISRVSDGNGGGSQQENRSPS